MKVDNGGRILALLLCVVVGTTALIALEDADAYACPYDEPPDCDKNDNVYYEDAPYEYGGYWVGARDRKDRRRTSGGRSHVSGRTRGMSRSTGTASARSTGPSYATMSRTPVSGGLMSGGHMSGSMGAGATIGHGHR